MEKNSNHKSRVWTIEERKQIEYLLKKKQTKRSIASYLTVSYEALAYEILRGGGKQNYSAEYAQTQSERTFLNEKRFFSQEEKDQIELWVEEGHGISYMRKKLGCGWHRLTEYLNSVDLNTKRVSIEKLLKRVECLEEHLKIIYDILEKK